MLEAKDISIIAQVVLKEVMANKRENLQQTDIIAQVSEYTTKMVELANRLSQPVMPQTTQVAVPPPFPAQQAQHGFVPNICEKCGAPLAISKKTNKPYCSALCWKK